jgi:ABC-type branched-subunit amino acid transport system substrate-binding protein
MIPSAGAISLAVADANEKFLGKLSYVWEQVDCDGTQATAAIGRMMQAGIVDAVIGPDCEASCEPSAAMTAGYNIAQISYSCSSDLLSDKNKYPTVAPPPPVALPTLRFCHQQRVPAQCLCGRIVPSGPVRLSVDS